MKTTGSGKEGFGPAGSTVCPGIILGRAVLAPEEVIASRANFDPKGALGTCVIDASVTSRLGIPWRATKRFWAGALVDTLGVSVRSGLALVGRFHFGKLAIGEPVGVWEVWCSEVLFIVGSVLDLIVVLRAALVDVARGVGWVFQFISPVAGLACDRRRFTNGGRFASSRWLASRR
jgi:hypothetical protein